MKQAGAGVGILFCRGCEFQKGRNGNQQDQQRDRHNGQRGALRSRKPVRALQGIASLQIKNAAADAGGKTDEAENSIEIAARDPQDHTEGTAEEHQAADHGKEPKNEARHRGTAAAGGELLFRQREQETAQNDPDDFRTEILNGAGTVQPQGAGRIADKAGDTEAHVLRVAQQNQHGGDHADDETGNDDLQFFLFNQL